MRNVAERSFPTKPKPSIERADVIAYLAELEDRGWDVYKDDVGRFSIAMGTMKEMTVSHREDTGTCTIQLNSSGITSSVTVETFGQFEHVMSRHFSTPPQITTTRLNSGEPATNVRRLVKMIGSSFKVEGVYDPWLDDEGLGVLLSMLRMSGSASPKLRLITGKSGAKNLTPHFVKLVFKELGCGNGRVRQTTNRAPHDRLYLLSRGKSIHVGPSLNNMDKAGQVSIHDSAKD